VQVAKPFPKGVCKHFKHWRVPIILHGTAFQDPRKLAAGEHGFAEPAFGAIHVITFTIFFPTVVLWLPKQVIPESVGCFKSSAAAGYICPQ
jgi:hypothetical protein